MQNIKKSQHIEFSDNSPKVVKGEQIDLKSIDDTIQFLKENAEYSKTHKKIATRTISILKQVYSEADKGEISKKLEKAFKKTESFILRRPDIDKEEISKKLENALVEIESISHKKPKPEIELESVRDKENCDFTFFCLDGEKVEDRHSFIMELPFFNSLSEKWKESLLEEKGFDLKQFPKEAVEIALDVVYGKPLPEDISYQNLKWVYSLANFLMLDDLKKLVQKEIKKHPENYFDELIQRSKEEERAFKEKNSDQIEPSPAEAYYSFLQECWMSDLSKAIPTEQKAQEIIPYLESFAEQNDPFSLTCLGYCYQNGLGVEQNSKIAKKFYIQASKQEFPPAQYHLGACYDKGIGVKRNPERALVHYQQASDQGFPPAQFALGKYFYRLGGEENLKTTLSLFGQASDQGFPLAQYALGTHFYGLEGEDDLKKAVDLFREASEQGFPSAQYRLGNCYRDGKGIGQNLNKAIKLYTRSSEQGCTEAQNQLAYFYEEGILVEKDLEKAAQLYTQASDKGSIPATNSLGKCYLYGIGVKKDYKKAVQLFKVAAKNNHADALFNLGLCYEKGWGTGGMRTDWSEGLKCYEKAINLGHPQAKINYKKLGRKCDYMCRT